VQARHGRPIRRAAAVALALMLNMATPPRAEDSDEVTEPTAEVRGPLKIPDSQIEVVDWRELDGWANDDHEAGFASFLASCRAVVNGAKSSSDERAMHAALVDVCRRAFAVIPLDNDGARGFFEENFRPVRISRLGDQDGFLTGYYEPIVAGSRVPTQQYTTPIYRRPDDLIVAGKPNKDGTAPNKAGVMREIAKGKFAPYYDRAEIEGGALDGRHLEICWVKDPIDLFFIQIQGSARIRLEDGAVLRLNYDAHNGYPYSSIGRILIDRKIFTKDEMSMERLRQWMSANPDEGRALRQMNKSFVFFRIAQLADHEEAVGAQGVPLTAGRSVAVDKALHVYGTPFFIEADLPIASAQSTTRFRRLMMAQDTGSAIIGPARADIYFGAGEEAARFASGIRHNARFTMLIPRDIDPVDAGAKFPLPPRQPGSVEPPPLVAAVAPAPVRLGIPLPLPRPGDAPKILPARAPRLASAARPVVAISPRPDQVVEAKPAATPVAVPTASVITDPTPAGLAETKPESAAHEPTAIERGVAAMTELMRTAEAVRATQLASEPLAANPLAANPLAGKPLTRKEGRATKSPAAEHGHDGASPLPRQPPLVAQQLAANPLAGKPLTRREARAMKSPAAEQGRDGASPLPRRPPRVAQQITRTRPRP
jgi:membrane-bound lytic murein transglycosylase A